MYTHRERERERETTYKRVLLVSPHPPGAVR